MASVDWQKIKSVGEAKAIFRHCATDTRMKYEHSNRDIDKSRSNMNQVVGDMGTYQQICESFDAVMSDLESLENANLRKDRVRLISLCIPAPAGMSEETSALWFTEAYRCVIEKYHSNVLGGAIHFDEIHEYTDAQTGTIRESRPHMHLFVVPEVNNRLNAKAFMTKQSMIELNNSLQAMTQVQFPQYTFMDGTKRKSRQSVEELKQQSDIQEMLDLAHQEAMVIRAEAQAERDAMEARLLEKEDALQREYDMRKKMLSDESRKDLEAHKQALEAAYKAKVQKALEELTGAYRGLQELTEAYQTALKQVEQQKLFEDQQNALEKRRRGLSEFDNLLERYNFTHTKTDWEMGK